LAEVEQNPETKYARMDARKAWTGGVVRPIGWRASKGTQGKSTLLWVDGAVCEYWKPRFDRSCRCNGSCILGFWCLCPTHS